MALKPIPKGNKGLPKLPKKVRNKMGFMKDGGLAEATAKLKAQGLKDGGPVYVDRPAKCLTKQKDKIANLLKWIEKL